MDEHTDLSWIGTDGCRTLDAWGCQLSNDGLLYDLPEGWEWDHGGRLLDNEGRLRLFRRQDQHGKSWELVPRLTPYALTNGTGCWIAAAVTSLAQGHQVCWQADASYATSDQDRAVRQAEFMLADTFGDWLLSRSALLTGDALLCKSLSKEAAGYADHQMPLPIGIMESELPESPAFDGKYGPWWTIPGDSAFIPTLKAMGGRVLHEQVLLSAGGSQWLRVRLPNNVQVEYSDVCRILRNDCISPGSMLLGTIEHPAMTLSHVIEASD
jgi:hypothetical protein